MVLTKGTKSKTDHWEWGSGGGIVAAALGGKQLGIDEGVCAFKGLATKAFKKRTGVDIPILGKLIMAHHHGKYKTSGLEIVLKDIFGHDYLFGGPVNRGLIPNLKVGVVATSSSRQTFLLTNYNRPPLERKLHKTIDIGSNEEADEEDIDNEDYSNVMDDIACAPTDKETGERSSNFYQTGTRHSRPSIIYDSQGVNIYTDLPEIDNREGSEKISRQSTEVDHQSEGSSDNWEDSYNEFADSRKHCYSSG